MEQSQYNFLFSFIWNIANDVLVNAFNKGDYKKVILPMLVLRRIDVLLEPTKDAVIQMKDNLTTRVSRMPSMKEFSNKCIAKYHKDYKTRKK